MNDVSEDDDFESQAGADAFRTIDSVAALAAFLETSQARLLYHLYAPGRPKYRRFSIPKKSCGVREIAAPPKAIRSFQHRLLRCMAVIAAPRREAHGFSRGRSVCSNARNHVGARYVLNLDLEDFFPSINFGRVRGMYCKAPFRFPTNVATVLAQICCDSAILPQGAPTSPHISNLICRGLDRDLGRLARKHGWVYSRYCDDVTFSGSTERIPPSLATTERSEAKVELGETLRRIIQSHGFKVNDRKTRLRHAYRRQEVTGLVVNRKMNVPREFIRRIRAVVHDCERRGYEEANRRFRFGLDRKCRRGESPELATALRGYLAYLQMVRGGDDPLHVRLAVRAEKVLPLLRTYGVPIQGQAARETSLLKECVGVLIGRNHRGEEVTTGTAVVVRGAGLVTTAHVFEEPDATRWEFRCASTPGSAFPVRAMKLSTSRDLAILQCAERFSASLCATDVLPEVGETVAVAGFPNWKDESDSLMVERGAITQLRIAADTHHLLTDIRIRSGNSGGPVISKAGLVIGIVRYDGTNRGLPNSAVSSRHLSEVAGLDWQEPPYA